MDEAIDEENHLPSGLDFRTHLNSGTPAWKRRDGIPKANVQQDQAYFRTLSLLRTPASINKVEEKQKVISKLQVSICTGMNTYVPTKRSTHKHAEDGYMHEN